MTGRDPGLQQERTILAWRRSGLALLVGALTIGRISLDTLGLVAVVPSVMVAGLALWVVLDALRARRLARTHPGEPGYSVLADGRLPAAVAVVVGTLGVVELAAAMSRLV